MKNNEYSLVGEKRQFFINTTEEKISIESAFLVKPNVEKIRVKSSDYYDTKIIKKRENDRFFTFLLNVGNDNPTLSTFVYRIFLTGNAEVKKKTLPKNTKKERKPIIIKFYIIKIRKTFDIENDFDLFHYIKDYSDYVEEEILSVIEPEAKISAIGGKPLQELCMNNLFSVELFKASEDFLHPEVEEFAKVMGLRDFKKEFKRYSSPSIIFENNVTKSYEEGVN